MRPHLGSLALVLTLVSLALTSQVSAQAPASCQTARNLRMYNLGYTKGVSLGQQAFASNDVAQDCDNYELFRDEVLDAIQTVTPPPAGGTAAGLCHYSGLIAGLLDEVQTVQTDCIDICILDGQFVGAVAARLYCALSISQHGLGDVTEFIPQATLLCGQNFESSCYDVFDELATFLIPGCAPYTTSPYQTVYDDTLLNQCAYGDI